MTDSYWLMIGGEGHLTVNLKRIVKEGLSNYMKRAKERLENLDLSEPSEAEQKPFLESVLITCDAVIKYAGRYAALAEKQAEETENPVRRKELQHVGGYLQTCSGRTCEMISMRPCSQYGL